MPHFLNTEHPLPVLRDTSPRLLPKIDVSTGQEQFYKQKWESIRAAQASGRLGKKTPTTQCVFFKSPFAHYLIIIIIYHHYPFISDGFVFALQNPFRWVSWWKVLDRIIRLSQSDHPKLCSIVQLCKTVKSWCEATNAQQREKVRSLEWSKSHG